MKPGTPVFTTALNRMREVMPSVISRMASSGRAETWKFSWMRLGVLEEVVRGAVPRWMAQARRIWAGVLWVRWAMAVMIGSWSRLGSLLWPRAAKAWRMMPLAWQKCRSFPFGKVRVGFDVDDGGLCFLRLLRGLVAGQG